MQRKYPDDGQEKNLRWVVLDQLHHEIPPPHSQASIVLDQAEALLFYLRVVFLGVMPTLSEYTAPDCHRRLLLQDC